MSLLTIGATTVMTAVVLSDIALPGHLHGARQYREDWIACRNALIFLFRLCGMDIVHRCRRADRIMAVLFDDPVCAA